MRGEISREALLIYLENLRILETIMYESKKELEIFINEDNREKRERRMSELSERNRRAEKPSLEVDIQKCSLFRNITYTIAILHIIVAFIASALFDLDPNGDFFSLCIGLGFFWLVLSGIAKLYIRLSLRIQAVKYKRCERFVENSQKDMQIYRASGEFQKDLAASKAEAEIIVQKIGKYLSELNKDITEAKRLLANAYAANIIPLPFRNIQGIYYLYDYLSTSSESLSSALMQCNLESIKQKLDKMIELQGEMILQQAQANARLFEQNQQILEVEQATMNNTAVAAQYARIAAVNSAVGLKMQQKQLAYQRAEYWLN